MTGAAARRLQYTDRVLWIYEAYSTGDPEPGTVTAAEPEGVHIFWQYGSGLPTFYPYDDDGSWSNIHPYISPVAHQPQSQNNQSLKPQKDTTK